ncbi:MAG: nucleoside monophosphate kinase [Planctomycetota bacterium]|nr:nucleoside monophosphate kinase [Planctomycetota bacterium]
MDALLLLGPTGAGKTPLGDVLEARGLHGRRCLHFDFGVQLRAADAAPDSAPRLDADQRAVIRRVLAEGTLLEDHEFPIAAALLDAFLDVRRVQPEDLLILNGLPRHVGQAQAIDALHEIRAVLQLSASAKVLHERIARDTGGDRASRQDDAAEQVAARIARFEVRTRPLVTHYADRGVAIVEVATGVESTALDAYLAAAEGLADALRSST